MSLSDPSWYEALRGNPIEAAAFDSELKSRIHDKALSSRKKQEPARLRGIWISGTAIAIGLMALIVFAGIPFDGRSEGLKDRFAGAHASLPPVTDTWQRAIDAKSPESRNEILFEHNVESGRKVIFSRRLYTINGYRALSLAADSYVQEQRQWKSSASYTYSEGIMDESSRRHALTSVWLLFDPVSYYFGTVADPRIRRIQVVDSDNRVVAQTATVKQDDDGYAYWMIPVSKPNFYGYGMKIEGLDANDRLVDSLYSN